MTHPTTTRPAQGRPAGSPPAPRRAPRPADHRTRSLEPPAMPGEECLACGHTFSGGETVHACAGGAVR